MASFAEADPVGIRRARAGEAAGALVMQDPYAIYFAVLVGGMPLLIVGVAGPLTTSAFLANLWVRGSIFAIALAGYFVMRGALAEIRPGEHEALYFSVLTGAFAFMLAVNGMVTLFGVVRRLCTPLEIAADEEQLEESRRRENEADREYSEWDRKYHGKRPDP